MYLFQYVLCVVLVLFSGFSQAGKGRPVESALTIAYVSVNTAVVQTGEQKKMRRVLEKEHKSIQDMINKRKNKYKKQVDKIKTELALLSESERAKKYEEIQGIQVAMDQFIKEKEIEFQRKEAELKNQFANRLRSVIATIASKSKVDVVRNRDVQLWVTERMDLTKKVVAAYKKKFK